MGHAARFVAGAADAARLPHSRYPEIAFAGRSNVGKSSLLNRLVGQRGLARVSKTPGRTQQINFFLIDERIMLVDLPGYGFARVPLVVQQQWKYLVETYLTQRRELCAVVVILDLRRGLEADDADLLEYLRMHRVPTLVAATKSDKLAYAQRTGQVAQLRAQLPPETPVIVCSAVGGDGMAQLWQAIEERCAPARSGRGRHATPRRP